MKQDLRSALPDFMHLLNQMPVLAWEFHSCLVAVLVDQGLTHEQANRASAKFFNGVFSVDVTYQEAWKKFEVFWSKTSKKKWSK